MTQEVHCLQGDQIGRNFAYWVIIFFGPFFQKISEVAKNLTAFLPGKKLCINFYQKNK
jgi:hypothetical protein